LEHLDDPDYLEVIQDVVDPDVKQEESKEGTIVTVRSLNATSTQLRLLGLRDGPNEVTFEVKSKL